MSMVVTDKAKRFDDIDTSTAVHVTNEKYPKINWKERKLNFIKRVMLLQHFTFVTFTYTGNILPVNNDDSTYCIHL